MVEVRYVEDEAELLTQLGEDEREGRGISAAGDRDDERTWSEDAVTACVGADGGDDRAWRGRGHRWLGWDSDPRSAGYESAALGHLSYPALMVMILGCGAPARDVRGTLPRAARACEHCNARTQ